MLSGVSSATSSTFFDASFLLNFRTYILSFSLRVSLLTSVESSFCVFIRWIKNIWSQGEISVLKFALVWAQNADSFRQCTDVNRTFQCWYRHYRKWTPTLKINSSYWRVFSLSFQFILYYFLAPTVYVEKFWFIHGFVFCLHSDLLQGHGQI